MEVKKFCERLTEAVRSKVCFGEFKLHTDSTAYFCCYQHHKEKKIWLFIAQVHSSVKIFGLVFNHCYSLNL